MLVNHAAAFPCAFFFSRYTGGDCVDADLDLVDTPLRSFVRAEWRMDRDPRSCLGDAESDDRDCDHDRDDMTVTGNRTRTLQCRGRE